MISGETALAITIDVGNGVAPADSKTVDYGTEEIAFYAEVKEDFAKWQADNPDAILEVGD